VNNTETNKGSIIK